MAGAESVSMLMTICVGASPPPIELARTRAQPRAQRASRGWVAQVLFPGLAFCFRWNLTKFEDAFHTSQRLFVGVGRRGGVFGLIFLATRYKYNLYDNRYLLTLRLRVCGSAGR